MSVDYQGTIGSLVCYFHPLPLYLRSFNTIIISIKTYSNKINIIIILSLNFLLKQFFPLLLLYNHMILIDILWLLSVLLFYRFTLLFFYLFIFMLYCYLFSISFILLIYSLFLFFYFFLSLISFELLPLFMHSELIILFVTFHNCQTH